MIQKKTQFDGVNRVKSAGHQKVVALLHQAYPRFTVLEEAPIRISDGGQQRTLSVDVVVKELKVGIEIHGQQHFEYVPYFHRTPDDLKDQQRRDQMKREAIINGGYSYVMVRFDEWEKLTVTKLLKKITKAIQESTQ